MIISLHFYLFLCLLLRIKLKFILKSFSNIFIHVLNLINQLNSDNQLKKHKAKKFFLIISNLKVLVFVDLKINICNDFKSVIFLLFYA